jgi:hypothetical protein
MIRLLEIKINWDTVKYNELENIGMILCSYSFGVLNYSYVI